MNIPFSQPNMKGGDAPTQVKMKGSLQQRPPGCHAKHVPTTREGRGLQLAHPATENALPHLDMPRVGARLAALEILVGQRAARQRPVGQQADVVVVRGAGLRQVALKPPVQQAAGMDQ
jgi:hypothetical protein